MVVAHFGAQDSATKNKNEGLGGRFAKRLDVNGMAKNIKLRKKQVRGLRSEFGGNSSISPTSRRREANKEEGRELGRVAKQCCVRVV